MVLCDQPLVDATDIQELLTAFTAHPEYDFCVPVVNGQRGNPVVVSRQAVEQILAMDRQVVCRESCSKTRKPCGAMSPPMITSSRIWIPWRIWTRWHSEPCGPLSRLGFKVKK